MRNKILVIGCGRLGKSVACHHSRRGSNVVVYDSNPSAFDRLDDDAFSGFTVEGDATDTAVLEDGGYVQTAKEAIIATGDDRANLFLSHLLSVIYEIPTIYVRFDDPEMSELVKNLPGVKPVYPFLLSFNAIVEGGEEK